MSEQTWCEYLQLKKDNNEKINVYLNEKTQIIKRDGDGEIEVVKTNNIMLSGFIETFDGKTLVLRDKECLIERTNVMTIKPEPVKFNRRR